MYEISSNIDWDGQGFFALKQGTHTLGQIKVKLTNGDLTLLDTTVSVKRNLHSIGVRLIHEIVDYARVHELKIITISKFVQKQFSSNPELYADVWEKA